MVLSSVEYLGGVTLMSAVLGCICAEKSYSYQHIHGVMLVNLNKLALKFNLSHSDYRLMGLLIGLWNKEQGKAFPTTDYIAKTCKMSKSTVNRSLNNLVNCGLLIIVRSKGKRNNYYISKLLLDFQNSTTSCTACDTAHDIKQNRIKTNHKQNDDSIKINITEKLKSWNFTGIDKTIKKYGEEQIKNYCYLIESKNPHNPGAYLRRLLESQCIIRPDFQKVPKIEPEQPYIKHLIKYKYWKHIPSNQIYKIKPDNGNHNLFLYNAEVQTITIYENNLIDLITNFKPALKSEYEAEILDLVHDKPEKEFILEQINNSANNKQLAVLKQLWKIK